MSEHVYLLTISLAAGTVLLVFGLRYLTAAQAAKARAAEAGTDTAATLASINATLVDLNRRVAAVEKILKDVS